MKLTRAVALLAHPIALAGAALVSSAITRKPGLAARFAIGLPLGVLVSKALKRAYPRQKPRLLTLTPRESMPSGHATATTAFALAIVDAYDAWRAAPVAVAGAAFVDACRLHDREHRLSEVLIGNAIGLAAATAASLVARSLRT